MTVMITPEFIRAENEARHPVAHVGRPRPSSSVGAVLRALRRERAADRGRPE